MTAQKRQREVVEQTVAFSHAYAREAAAVGCRAVKAGNGKAESGVDNFVRVIEFPFAGASLEQRTAKERSREGPPLFAWLQ